MIKAYIAAPWELKSQAIKLAYKLQKDFKVDGQCRWFTHQDGDSSQECISNDMDDIDNSNIFILINPEDWKYKGTGGRHFETGYAFLAGIWIIILGTRTNLFHHHKDIDCVENYSQLSDLLKFKIGR